MPEILKIGISGMVMAFAVAVQLSILLFLSSAYSISRQHSNECIFQSNELLLYTDFRDILRPSAVIGANFGAGNFNRVREAFFYFGKISLIISGILWLFFQIFAPFILSWFITDTEIILSGTSHFRIFMSSFIVYGFIAAAIMLFMAIGSAGKGAVLTLGRQILFFIPLAFILPRIIGEKGVWLSYPLGDFLITILGLILVFSEIKKLNTLQIQKKETINEIT